MFFFQYGRSDHFRQQKVYCIYRVDLLLAEYFKTSLCSRQSVLLNFMRKFQAEISFAESKTSMVLMVLGVCYLMFVGSSSLMWHYQFFFITRTGQYELELVILMAVALLFSLNGLFNGFSLLIFPSMRQALAQGIKKIFHR